MSRKYKTVWIGLFLVIGLQGWAQTQKPTAGELLLAAQEFFNQKEYVKAEMQYTLYRNSEAPITIEKYDGLFIKNKEDIYLKIQDTEILHKDSHYLKVNHSQKAMEYAEGHDMEQNPMVLERYLNLFAEQEVKDLGTVWQCTLTAPKFTQLPYGRVIFYISKENNQLQKQIMELVAPAAILDENGKRENTQKHLEIAIRSLRSSNASIPHSEIATFVNISKSTAQVTSAYKTYKLINRTLN